MKEITWIQRSLYLTHLEKIFQQLYTQAKDNYNVKAMLGQLPKRTYARPTTYMTAYVGVIDKLKKLSFSK